MQEKLNFFPGNGLRKLNGPAAVANMGGVALDGSNAEPRPMFRRPGPIGPLQEPDA